MAATNAGGKLYVAATPQNTDLDQDGFEALTWVQVTSVGSIGATGASTNVVTYDTWDTDVTQKGHGITDGGSPEIEVLRVGDDPGQIILRTAAENKTQHAFKIVHADKLTIGGNGTTKYNRGIVTGPSHPNGRNEDFILEMFTLGMNQREIVVNPT